jgi:iron complex outermembrane receptor protein
MASRLNASASRNVARWPALLLIAACSILQAETAGADTVELADLSLEQLLRVEVTSVTKSKQDLQLAAAAIHVISADDIRRSGASSLPDALRLVPGIHVAQIDGNKWAISARGFNGRFANKLMVLIDGRSLYTPSFAGVYWDMHDVLLEDVDRIEVIRGPGAALWGVNAVNGFINVITKSSKETHGTLLQITSGTQTRGEASMRYGGQLGPDAHFRVFSKAFDRRSQFNRDGSRADDSWRSARSGFRVDWEVSKKDTLLFLGDMFQGDSGQTALVGSLGVPVHEFSNGDVDTSGGNILGRWERKLSSRSTMSFQAYFDHFRRKELGVLSDKRSTGDIEFQVSTDLTDRHRFSWGSGYRQTSDELLGSFAVQMDPANRTLRFANVFVHDEFQLVPRRVYLTLGSKFEHATLGGFQVQPTARILWAPSRTHSFWAALSRASRTPSRTSQDIRLNNGEVPLPDGSAGRAYLFGSRDFNSETLTAVEAGYRAQPTRRTTLELSTFYNMYDELLSVEPRQPYLTASVPLELIFPAYFVNQAEGNVFGTELSATFKPHARWKLAGSYSWLSMNLRTKPGAPPQVLLFETEQAPSHQAQMHSYLDITRTVRFDASAYYVDSFSGAGVFGVQGIIPSYLRVDARVAWRPTSRWELVVGTRNALDDRHPEFIPEVLSRQSEVGRAVFGAVTVRF